MAWKLVFLVQWSLKATINQSRLPKFCFKNSNWTYPAAKRGRPRSKVSALNVVRTRSVGIRQRDIMDFQSIFAYWGGSCAQKVIKICYVWVSLQCRVTRCVMYFDS